MTKNFKRWLKCALIRSIKTIAQSALGALGGCAIFSEVNWAVVVSTALFSGLYSILTSLAGIPEAKFKDDSEELFMD